MMRSMLFVPADSERKLSRAAQAGADALILDLEDSVVRERKALARSMAREYLASVDEPLRRRVWVRVNDLVSGELLKDLAGVLSGRPAGVVLPKIRCAQNIEAVRRYIEALEAREDIEAGTILMTLVVTETPAAVLRLGEIIAAPQERVHAVMWGAEDLSAALGASDPRTSRGEWRPTYEYARSQCLLTAHALHVEAIDTVYIDYRDLDGLTHACTRSRRDGFTGRVAIHPSQVPIINEAFTPTAEEIALAHRIVSAFAGGGVAAIDGKMYDIPHLKAARRILGER